MTTTRPSTAQTSTGGVLSPALRATTIGVIALVSLTAFEALALTTVMPTIAHELDGESLYAMAFTATLAAGIVSIVWSGNLADRRGPRPPLVIGLVLFAAGLVGAGLAPTMHVLIAARVVQGLGAGMTSTALYVVVTRVYPQRLHTAILAGFSAAWVVPSLVGPLIAGLITQALGWRWVFGLSIVVLVGAGMLLARILPSLAQDLVAVPWRGRALLCAVVLAVGVFVLNAAAENLDARGVALAVVAVAVVGLSALPLTPRGTLRLARGLPTDVALRALAFAGFSGAEIYLPRLLTDRDGLSPTLAGLSLTVTGVTWFAGSSIQGRWDRRFEIGRTATFALTLMTITLALMAVGVATAAPAWVLIALFPLAGFGIGTLYPRVTAQALSRADANEEGFVSSALQIGDSAGGATAIAVSAVVFAAVGGPALTAGGSQGAGGSSAYVAVFAALALPVAVGALAGRRVR